jgi:hypothetical protein
VSISPEVTGVLVDTEPCPYCDGTGSRAVMSVPPPKPVGRPPGSTVAQHGTNSTYCGGCRCRPCKDAHRAYEKARKARRYIAEYEAAHFTSSFQVKEG